MNPVSSKGRWFVTPALILAAAVWIAPRDSYSATNEPAADEIRIISIQGTLVITRGGIGVGVRTQATNQPPLNPGDRLRTEPNSRVTLRWSDQSVVPLGASTEIEILPLPAAEEQSGLRLIKGILSFFHRDKPGRIRVITLGAVAGVKGTEFVMSVEPADNGERTTISVVDGTVNFYNDEGTLLVTNRQQAVAQLGKAPVHTAGFNVNNVLQWCFYYPAVLDLADLPLKPEEQGILRESLAAYREGDLLAALAEYPAAREPGSDAERVYYAALLLSVGQVERTEDTLALLPAAEPTERLSRLANALRQLIAAVKRETRPSILDPQLSTEFLAASYYEQSRAVREGSLKAALYLAWQAATNSPEFGFGWARVAELEFSFGRTRRSLVALNQALALSPRNAQALALQGFLLAAQNKTREAIESFNQAIAVDGNLGNAWLGRGLCRIRRGDRQGGREDLLIAAALEPQRAVLRSYLGKAYADVGDESRAEKEIQLAKSLDLNDPTAWLYSALLNQQQNRINEAIRDLERSQELNENRRLYRSKLLLDQDRAVRSVNLASIYLDAGMTDWSVREAGRAVNADYANYSAHLFLANSYNALRDPQGINQRYETPAFAEYLIANLLAPVGAGTLSPSLSQQEYSKLFEQDRLSLISSTEYSSNGDWLQTGSQYGTLGRLSYSFDAYYRWQQGQRPNNDLEDRALSFQIKQQLSPYDTVLLQGLNRKAESGDLLQYYDQAAASSAVRVTETIDPIVLAGYHHEWSPASHTLFLGSWLTDEFEVNNPAQVTFFVSNPAGMPDLVAPILIDEQYQNEIEIFSAELQQLWRQKRGQSILGARYQWGEFRTRNLQIGPPSDYFDFFVPDVPAAQQDFTTEFERLSFYAYQHLQVLDSLTLLGGVVYDHITHPENFRAAPISDQEETQDGFVPKAGIIWTPGKRTTVRAAYTRSLSGASFDQSFQLEPSQVAGFNQSFRSIIPESVGGANVGAMFETIGWGVEQRFGQGTYAGIQADWLESEVRRTLGAFELVDPLGFVEPSGIRETLDYRERLLTFTLNQLLDPHWSAGLRYRLAVTDLEVRYPGVPDSAFQSGGFTNRQHLESLLHQVDLHVTYNLPEGWFLQFQASWYMQDNDGYTTHRPGDDFWHLHAWAGYRFPRRQAEVQVGLLNLTDQDYQLNPLTLYNEPPRERTFALRLQFSF